MFFHLYSIGNRYLFRKNINYKYYSSILRTNTNKHNQEFQLNLGRRILQYVLELLVLVLVLVVVSDTTTVATLFNFQCRKI